MMQNGMNRKLTDDVDLSTMRTMRDRGMSNTQISRSLGVSYATVWRYLGKQPKSMPRENKYQADGEAVSAASTVVQYGDVNLAKVLTPDSLNAMQMTSKDQPVLKIISTKATLQGDANTYVVDTQTGQIEISGLVNGILDKDTIACFVAELAEIKKMFED